jgi:hypothetical protein
MPCHRTSVTERGPQLFLPVFPSRRGMELSIVMEVPKELENPEITWTPPYRL